MVSTIGTNIIKKINLRPGTDLSTNANEASRGRMSMKVLHVGELHKRSTRVCSFCLGLPRSRSCSSLYPALVFPFWRTRTVPTPTPVRKEWFRRSLHHRLYQCICPINYLDQNNSEYYFKHTLKCRQSAR